jgi:hypothetical protein
MLRSLLCALSCGPLLAQTAPPPPNGDVRVDAVIATVNDNPILWSELQAATAGMLRSLRSSGVPVTAQQVDGVFRRALKQLIDKNRLAQSAKTFGVYTPEQVESILRSETEREKEEQRRDLGSVQAVSRELKRQQRSWGDVEREKRTDTMAAVARSAAVHQRMDKKANLFVTPRMLRQVYEAERFRFVGPASARLVQIRFQGRDAEEQAAKAAEQWTDTQLTPREVADRFPGAVGLNEVDAEGLSPDYRAVAAFALAGPAGAVSAPIRVGDAVVVARVTLHQPARDGRFHDESVQQQLRRMCEDQVRLELERSAMERAEDRTVIWLSPSLLR